jgi:hypothetical protein
MAFADPQTVTIGGTATTLPRTSSDVNAGAFTKDDGNVKLRVSHQYGKRTRRLIRLDSTKVAADPFLSGTNVKYSMSVSLVVDVPPVGYTIAEQKALIDALTAYLTASTGARATQLLGGEN